MASKMLSSLERHPSVHSTSDERGSYDGVWIYLAPGWLTDDGQATIHEDTITAAAKAHRYVTYQPGAWTERYVWAYPDQVGLLPGG